MRYVKLTEEEMKQLSELHKTSSNSVIRERSLCLLLSEKGNLIIEVSRLLNVHRHTVRRLVHKWDLCSDADKLSVLYSAKGQGAKVKLEPVAELLPEFVETHNKNLKPILYVLEKKHRIKFCKPTLQTFLKGAGL